MAGASAIFGLGMLESGITFDFLQAVLDNDIARMVKFAVKGISVTDEFMALDEIKEAGLTGNFMMSPLTFKHMRSMPSKPDTFERNNRSRWESSGRVNAEDAAKEKLLEIFKNHKPEPLNPSVAEDIRNLREETEKAEGIKSEVVPFDLAEDYIAG
jgi:trimethylamine--corrinoid protein Co-methyltransferase